MSGIKEIVADLFPSAKREDVERVDIASRINKEIVRFKRANMDCNAILLGRKECEELKNKESELLPEIPEGSVILIKGIEVDMDSYFRGAVIIPDESEE